MNGTPAGSAVPDRSDTPPAAAPVERRASTTRGSGDRRRAGRRSNDLPGGASAGVAGPDTAWLGGLADHGTADSVRVDADGAQAFQRFYRLFLGARVIVGLALLTAHVGSSMLGVRPAWGPLLLSLGYGLQALVMWLLPWLAPGRGVAAAHLTRTQWLATVGVDVLAFVALHLLEVGSAFNYVALLVLPVLMAGVLTARRAALGTAAGVTLLLFAAAWRGALGGGDLGVLLMQAGLAGTGLFVIVLLSSELAARLVREQLSARGSLELARQQAQLSRLVIEQMAEGVLVVDRRLHVRAANPSARRLLAVRGLAPPAPFVLGGLDEWQGLAQAVTNAFSTGTWTGAEQDVAMTFAEDQTRTLRLRGRFTGRRAGDSLVGPAGEVRAAEELCVLFLEDLRTVQARSRQEKLAAMGRVSAGIAHEIRNPLAAISQANALLQEDTLAPGQQRLARIVADNAARLARIVDDVLEVAPGTPPDARVVDTGAEVSMAVAEWARTVRLALGPSSRLQVRLPPDAAAGTLTVRFDDDHLRRVLVNLLDNAYRHAGEQAGAIVLELARDGEQVRLSVCSDGAPIQPDVERHLFEPFFSTRSRGSGLGLYICRELCERYGASLEYRLRPAEFQQRNEFRVTMRLVPSLS